MVDLYLGVIGTIFSVLTLGRSLLVVDGVLDFHGYGSMVYRFLSCFRQLTSPSGHEGFEEGALAQASRRSGTESPRKFRWV